MAGKRYRDDGRDTEILSEVEHYRKLQQQLFNTYNKLNIQTVTDSFDAFQKLLNDVQSWEIVKANPQPLEKIKRNVVESDYSSFEGPLKFDEVKRKIGLAFDEIREQYVDFNWLTLKYYVKKRLQEKGFPVTEPQVIELSELRMFQCRTSGNPLINSLQFNNPDWNMFPNPHYITCTVIFNGASLNKDYTIANYEDLEDVLNTQIHPDAKYVAPASALHWTALSRLIDLLELHYV
jgi:hypothetical protein